MRFSIFNFLMLLLAIAAIVGWRIDKSRFEKAIANYGEYELESHWEEIHDGDVLDVATIHDVSFVYCHSDVVQGRDEEISLDQLGTPIEAEKNGYPNDAIRSLINDLCGYEIDLEFETATAEGGGDTKFWRVHWFLYPAQGGSSGPPSSFIAVVRADGSAVRPRIYLRDTFGSIFSTRDNLIYSMMPIDHLQPESETAVDEKKVIQVATEYLTESLKSLNVQTGFRFDGVARRTFDSALSSRHKDKQAKLEVWAVDFVDSSIPITARNGNSSTRITIWVTSEFETSTLSVGTWELQEGN